MGAFIDARCAKCGARIGWFGEIADQPPCSKCGHKPDRTKAAADQAEMDAFEKFLIDRKKAKDEKSL